MRALLVLILIGLLPRIAAASPPRGHVRMWAEERYERWGPFGDLRGWEGSRVHTEGEFRPINSGSWRFFLDASERGQELQIRSEKIPSPWGRFSLNLGDAVLSPREDALRREFQHDVWYRGAALGLSREKWSVGLRAGELTERKGVFGWGRQPVSAQTFGLTLSGTWREHGVWKADWDRQQPVPLKRSGRQVTQFFFGQSPEAGWSWMTETRLSREDGSRWWGGSLVAGGGFTGPKLSARGHVRRISAAFQGMGIHRDPHTNEWGGRFEISHRPRGRVYFGGSVDWGRDVSANGIAGVHEQRLTSRAFLTAPVFQSLYFQSYLTYRNRTTPDPDSLLVDQGAFTGAASLGWRYKRTQASVSLSRTLLRDPTREDGDWREDRISAQFVQGIGRRVRAEFRGRFTERRLPDGSWQSRERDGEMRTYWDRRPNQRGWVFLGRDYQEANQADFERDQWNMGAGWEQPLPWDLALSVEGLFFFQASDRGSERTRWNFRVSRGFSFGKSFRKNGPDGETLPEIGFIEGAVFEDRNGNGLRDPGETGISGIPIKAGSGTVATTAFDGSYIIPDATTGWESVTMEVSRLPTRYLSPNPARYKLPLRPGERVFQDFPVRLSAGVSGRVVMNEDGNRTGVPNVLVRVRGTHHDAFTDDEGRFLITGLESGPVTVEVILWSLPEKTEVDGSVYRDLVLVAGESVSTDFTIKRERPNIIQIFRPEPK